MKPAPLVLLHGWGLTPAIWAPFREALGADIDHLAPALPGHAGSAAPESTSIEAWSDAFLPALPERAVLCGWSLGGLVALDLARRHPERVAALVLIGTTPCFVGSEPDWPHGLAGDTVQSFINAFVSDPDATLRRFTALQTLGDENRRAVSRQLTDAFAPIDASTAPALYRALSVLAETDLRSSISDIRQPALILHGEADALMPVAAAHWLQRVLPHASITRYANCGHAPFVSQPDLCAAQVRAFLEA